MDPRRADRSAAPARPAADRCPGVLSLHEAGDGLLARIRLPGGRLDDEQRRAIVNVAGLGNGVVEITSRANLQVRGLAAGSTDDAAALLAAAGLLPSVAHERVRNILASPLAGRHPSSVAAVDDIVDALDRGLCADPVIAELPGRFLFGVDDGSGLGMDSTPDIVLRAEDARMFRLSLAGWPTTIVADAARAVTAALSAARAFIWRCDGAWRIADVPDGPRLIAGELGAELGAVELPRVAGLEPGVTVQRDGRLAVTALAPLGSLAPARLRGSVRLSTRRTVTVVDVAAGDEARTARTLEAAGLLVSASSGWWGLTACSGSGACARAQADVRAAAARRADRRAPGARPEHWAACARGCGRPPGVEVCVLAADGGVVVEHPDGPVGVADIGAAEALLAEREA